MITGGIFSCFNAHFIAANVSSCKSLAPFLISYGKKSSRLGFFPFPASAENTNPLNLAVEML